MKRTYLLLQLQVEGLRVRGGQAESQAVGEDQLAAAFCPLPTSSLYWLCGASSGWEGVLMPVSVAGQMSHPKLDRGKHIAVGHPL